MQNMMTINQAVGLVVAISLTIIFILIGYQIILILQEVRKGLTKINHIIDRTKDFSDAIVQPVTALTSLLSGIKTGKRILSKAHNESSSQE